MPSASSTDLAVYGDPKPGTGMSRTISDRENQIVTGILREFAQVQTRRSMFAMQWEEIAALILPTSKNTFFYQSYNTPGQKKTQQQVDATGALALHRFCAIVDSLVTPRNLYWHGLQGDEYVMKDRATRLWLESTTKLLFRMRYAANANFAAQNYNKWQSTGAFGNSTMYTDKFDNRWHGGGRGLRYKALPLGETFFGENHQGKVDRMIRWFRLTAYQAVQKWGRAMLPESLVPALESSSEWRYNFLHCVKPRADDYDPEALDHRSMPFSSHYVSIEGRCLMEEESGYRTFPFATDRYDQSPGEVEGRGPGQIVLPSLKTLNAQKVIFLKTGHRAADPVLLMADDGLVGMNLRPGSQNKGGVTSDGKPLVHTLPTGDIKISIEMMQEERGIIDDVFLVSLFKVLSEHPDMTATQVIQLVNEKGMLVAPTLGRQHTEYVGGLVPRELDLLMEMGMLDRPPPRLIEAAGRSWRGLLDIIEVTDTSPLAQMAQGAEVAGFFRMLEQLREVVNVTQNPGYLDRLDFETAIPEIARNQMVPERWITSDQKFASMQQDRAKAAAQKQATDALPAQAAIIKARAVAARSGMLEQPQGALQ
jgi:Bacteriophage head to tail connecting protein